MTPITLCYLDDIEDGGSAGFAYGEPDAFGFRKSAMVIRRGERVFVFENACPHVGAPLDFQPGKFLNAEGTLILCSSHGALFRIEDGYCISGPCAGKSLTPITARIEEGRVSIDP